MPIGPVGGGQPPYQPEDFKPNTESSIIHAIQSEMKHPEENKDKLIENIGKLQSHLEDSWRPHADTIVKLLEKGKHAIYHRNFSKAGDFLNQALSEYDKT